MTINSFLCVLFPQSDNKHLSSINITKIFMGPGAKSISNSHAAEGRFILQNMILIST